jgi:PHS family inorganic phosphate transporter-like MFS transporter
MGGESQGWLSSTITGMANFSAQYNFQVIALVLLVMSASECTTDDDGCKEGTQAPWVTSTANASVFLGAIAGQLCMGFLGDLTGRNLALCLTLTIAGVSSILTAILSVGDASAVYAVIISFRFTLGVGLGGVYPLAAVKAAEDNAEKDHHDSPMNSSAAGWSYFWQMPGFFIPWLLGYILSYSGTVSTSGKWRLLLALGCVPSFIAVGLLCYESSINLGSFKKLFSERPTHTQSPITFTEIPGLLQQDSNGRKLALSGSCWFLFDLVLYGIGLLTGHILANIEGDDDNVSSNESIRNLCALQMIAATITIIFCFLSTFLISRIGLKNLQIFGFCFVGGLCLLLSSLFEYLNHYNSKALFGLYCLTYASLNFGLGATTYAYPAAIFPKTIRSTFNGIASACGKAGAFFGAFTFIYMVESAVGFSGVIGICSFVAFLGATLTYSLTKADDIRDLYTSAQTEKKTGLLDGNSLTSNPMVL